MVLFGELGLETLGKTWVESLQTTTSSNAWQGGRKTKKNWANSYSTAASCLSA
jgi:hypothetical protein